MMTYPEISPEILRIGPLAIRWYGLMYVIGYVIGYQLLKNRIRRGLLKVSAEAGEQMVTYMILGMLLGARLVYVTVYNWDYYSENLVDAFKIWHGGLSFHGAALGMVVASALYARKYKLHFYSVTDALAYCAAPGLFFGRMGNFFNAELYGRATDLPWAMIFPTDPNKIPRHPSQLYQGFTEGLLLFALLWFFQRRKINNKTLRIGDVGAWFLLGYGSFRFITEYAREPDAQLGLLGFGLSMGQILCLLMVSAGLGVAWDVRRRNLRPKL